MKFEDLILAALSAADEEPGEQIFEDTVAKGINQAYMMVATTLEPQLNSIVLTQGSDMQFPSDFVDIVDIFVDNQRLSQNDYRRVGDTLRIMSKDYAQTGTEYILDYYCFPELLDKKTDIPVISEPRQLLLIDYGAYECLLLKRKYEAATARLASFMSAIGGNSQ